MQRIAYPKPQIQSDRLQQLDTEMMAKDGPRFKYLCATRDGIRYRICIKLAAERVYVATTTEKVGVYIMQGRGQTPRQAFTALTAMIEWNLRRSVQEALTENISVHRNRMACR